MRFRGGTALAGLLVALCVWLRMPRRSAAGTTEVVFGKVGGSILLLCRNVSKEATEVLWFQGDPRSFPPLFSSRVTFPPDVRFSLVDNSSLRISELRLQDEGNYTCKEVLNKTDHEHRVQLLVANPPRSTPKCWAESSSSGLMLQLFCSWPGGYPHPTLHWQEEGHDLENSSWLISSTSSSDTHVETLNSSYLSHRKVFKCVGSHVVKQEEPACSVEIKVPSLELEPPKTCFVGDNVTLTCRVTESVPAARLTWLRGITQPEIEPGGRYFIAQEGNVSHLTIQNCSQGIDGGCYICKAQNPVGLREVFVCLTVKQPTNIVGVVGAVVVLSLMAVLTISGVVLYYNPLLCLRGAAFRSQDSDDVLVLVDSEDDDDDDERNKEENTVGSSIKQEVMALVNGNSIQAAYLNCPTEGDKGELHSVVPLQKTNGEDAQGT
ncbi:V-set and immunoglobulin domain-containing protein 10 [Centrocercus urophasianus]|uniref:V-set and immunoglobulin domain-containing protein 10 n=1 Tax=Centrocercus urophasianus TaxID=9002 RepID=UPI001C6497EC|nr:V-set and immunoglobulin domain-containing protein 10 [Centrocercus urophasianus]